MEKLPSALVKAQSEIKAAKKDSDNPFFKSKYADLSSVWDACRKALTDNGFSVVQGGEVVGDHFYLKTTLLHSSGESISGLYPVISAKNDPQGLGSAYTYARRYSLAALVGVVTTDDDGEGAMDREKKEDAAPKAKVTANVDRVFGEKADSGFSKELTSKDFLEARIIIKNISMPKEGKKNWGFVDSTDTWYNTDKPEHVEELKKAKGDKIPRIVQYKPVGKYRYIQSVGLDPVVASAKEDEANAKVAEIIEDVPF